MLATPGRLRRPPPAPRWRAPRLGEHTREVLAELGLDGAAIDVLIADGVAVAADPAETG